METSVSRNSVAGKKRWPRQAGAAGLVLALLLAGELSSSAQREATRTGAIPAEEFSRMIQEFSEEGGFFMSDNFTSNETAYLHITGRFKDLGISGGAYLGVGPEQNFSYIAKVHPRIAFIVDIRRQAMIQHLLYKAIFQLADTRAQFLAWLFSKPIPGRSTFGPNAAVEDLLEYASEAPTTKEAFQANLTLIRQTIERDFRVPLSKSDAEALEYIYTSFWRANLRISFRFGNGGYPGGWWGGFPNLRDLILATDSQGKMGNFLASEEDYQFVRNLQRQNRVIPVVGDFAGKKALATVGEYLQENGYTVAAFYTSNVEQFLFGNDVFGDFVENVRKLPISDKSVFIRAVRSGWDRHPAAIPGHRMTNLLERISVFLKDYDAGLYPDYWSLAITHFIAPKEPSRPAVPVPGP